MGALKYYDTGTSTWKYVTNNPTVAAIIFAEDMVGAIDGTNKIFTTSQPFSSVSPIVNGVSMRLGSGNDFTITGTNQITFVTAPKAGSSVSASYATAPTANISGANSFIFKEVPTGAINGTNGLFTASRAYVPGSLQVYVNGLAQSGLVAETNPAIGTFTIDAPLTNDNIYISYQFAASVAGNADTVDGIHASPTPVAGQLLALNSRAQSGEWWEELGRTTLTAAGDTITVSGFPAKAYLQFIIKTTGVGTVNQDIRFNNDTGANYAYRRSINGAADATGVSQTAINISSGDSNNTSYTVFEVLNTSTLEKMVRSSEIIGPTGATAVPSRLEIVAKWVNTSSQITRIDLVNTNTGDLAIGSEVIVLGHD